MKGSPFTLLCQQLGELQSPDRVDLHVHSVFSDGNYELHDLIDRAIKSRLCAIAISDHDSTEAFLPAVAMAGNRIEVVPAAEITTQHRDREFHLLAYDFDVRNESLQSELKSLRDSRRERVIEITRRLIPETSPILLKKILSIPDIVSLGRRHIARILVDNRFTNSLHGAFVKYLMRPEFSEIERHRIAIGDTITLVRRAGGFCSLAHPPEWLTFDEIRELKALGLNALECVYPWPKPSHGKKLREWAKELKLSITGGSDSHDSTIPHRSIGSRTIAMREFSRIRQTLLSH